MPRCTTWCSEVKRTVAPTETIAIGDVSGLSRASASPCKDVCRMDPASGWCEGCLRTIDEIAAWSGLSATDRSAILARLPERRVEWERRTFGDSSGADGVRIR